MFKKAFFTAGLMLSISVSASATSYMGVSCDAISSRAELANITTMMNNHMKKVGSIIDRSVKNNLDRADFDISYLETKYDFSNFVLDCMLEIDRR